MNLTDFLMNWRIALNAETAANLLMGAAVLLFLIVAGFNRLKMRTGRIDY